MNCSVTLKNQRLSLQEEVGIYSVSRYKTDNYLRFLDLSSSTSFPMPSSTNFTSNTFDVSSILFPDPVIDAAAIADFSPPVFQDPASSLQWTFPSIIPSQHLLGPLDEFQNPELNFFAQDNCLMFDATMMGLYSSGLSGGSVLPSTDKAAKQRKLLEIQETARRLEAEIAASSVF